MNDQLVIYALICVLTPLVSFLVTTFFGKRLPRGGDWIALGAIGISLLTAFIIFARIISEYDPDFSINPSFEWVILGGNITFPMGILIDNITAFMLVVVTVVSSLVHLYSVGYMKGDGRYHQFFSFLSLFSFSMLTLVLADNLLLLYVGWELVGLSSYLLIGFYFEKNSAALACKKAFVTNRIGDFGMFVGMMIIFITLGVFNYSDVFAGVADGSLSGGLLTVAGVCLFCGAIGKSAQFPLHVWLPDAMEGPTPVSALIHAATMVAAGVYMVTRMFCIFTPDALLVIAYIGAITAILGSTIAVAQYDIKRVLAYSTISQLGYMIMGLGVGAYTAGFFHLMTHAAFKACLFLGSGSVILALHHEQDMRNMGGLRKKMPITFATFLLATLALSGIPFTSGFLSKDAILAGALGFGFFYKPVHFLLPLLGFAAAGLTAFYMFRLIFLTFFGKPRDVHKYDHAVESPASMTVPLVILATLSIWFWYSANPVNAHGWFHDLVPKPASLARVDATGRHSSGLFFPGAATAFAAEISTGEEDVHSTDGERQHESPAHSGNHGSEAVSTVSGGHSGHDESAHGHSPLDDATHKAHYPAMILSILLAGGGIFAAYKLYYLKPEEMLAREARALENGGLFRAAHDKLYFDEFYQRFIIGKLLGFAGALGRFDFKIIDGIVNGLAKLTAAFAFLEGRFDNKFIDGFVNKIADGALFSGSWIRKIETGRLQQYLAGALAGVLVIILVYII